LSGIDLNGLLTVHVWDFRGKDIAWGHASITLEDGTHISWWPSTNRKYALGENVPIYSAEPNDNQTFARDVKLEKSLPDWQLKIVCLDEDKIKDWWISYKENHNWETLGNNCSTVVYRALHIGGGPLKFQMIWRPDLIKDYAEQTKKEVGG
jgi:hypothetical protein